MMSPKQLVNLAARYWAQYLRKPVSGYDSANRAKLDNPLREAFIGLCIDDIIKDVIESGVLTEDTITQFESNLQHILFYGFETISQFSNAKVRIDGIIDTTQHLFISVDYDPDVCLAEALNRTFNEKAADKLCKVFPCKTRMAIRKNKKQILVSEGYAARYKILNEDLSLTLQNKDLNIDFVEALGFARKDNYGDTSLKAKEMTSWYQKGQIKITEEALNSNPEEFIKAVREKLECQK